MDSCRDDLKFRKIITSREDDQYVALCRGDGLSQRLTTIGSLQQGKLHLMSAALIYTAMPL